MATSKFLHEINDQNYSGTNKAINKRLSNTFNQFTRTHNDECAYTNEVRIMRKPFKYYTNRIWAPSPTNERQFSYYTPVGNQKIYNVGNNVQFPSSGSPTHLGDKRMIQYVQPFVTSPLLGSNTINTADIDLNSEVIRFGTPTNLRINPKDVTSATDYNRWEFVDPNLVQNPDHIIFADGVIPRGGISSRNELRNYMSLTNC
jgi:hypothetical protein